MYSLSLVNEYKEKVKNEAISKGLLVNKVASKKIIIKDIIISIIFYILALIIFNLSFNIILNKMTDTLVILVLVLLSFLTLFIGIFPIYKIYSLVILYKRIQTNTYFRSEKGEEVNTKLEGLKNYLNEFSVLSERGK